MSEFKSQAEVWQALLDGKTIYEVDEPHMTECYRIINGTVMYKIITSDIDWDQSNNRFHCYKSYGIYQEQNKNIVRMAPALVYIGGYYRLTDSLFANEVEPYHQYPNTFIKWLIDTHAVDVEVDDD